MPKSKQLRILLIHRYFWPDSPPYASLLREIGQHWSDAGYEVSVLSTQPSYKIEVDNPLRPAREQVGSLNVLRMSLIRERSRSSLVRGLNSLIFALKLFLHLILRGGRYDVVMCSTIPPVVTGMAVSIPCKLRGCKFIYHTMDIWPEVAVISKQLKPGVLYRWLRWLDTRSCRRSAAIVCLSQDMRETYLKRDKNLESRITVLNNFELPVFDSAVDSHRVTQSQQPEYDDRFELLFAGNLGKYQGLEAVVESAGLVQNEKVLFTFLGEGAARDQLIEAARANGTLDRNVRFMPHQPPSEAKRLISSASLCLVTLAPGVASVAFPSKTTTILALGCPVAVMVELESELARMVRDHGLGIAVGCGDSQALAQQIDALASDPTRLDAMRASARHFGLRQATAAAVLPKWTELIERIRST